jgi:hypothetical protein
MLLSGCKSYKKDNVILIDNSAPIPKEKRIYSYRLKTDDIEELLNLNNLGYLIYLHSLDIHDNDLLMDLNFLKNLSNLNNLNLISIRNCNNIKDIEPLKYLQKGKLRLNIIDCNNIIDLEPLKDVKNIHHFKMNTSNPVDLLPFKYMQNLEIFEIAYTNKVKNFNAVFEAQNIKYVSIANFSEYNFDFGELFTPSNLGFLHIFSKTGIDMENIEMLQNLTSLSLTPSEAIIDFKNFEMLKNLDYLCISCYDSNGLNNAFKLKNNALKRLNLNYGLFNYDAINLGKIDLNYLSELTNIERLYLNFWDIKDTTPLSKLPNLKIIEFGFSSFDPMPLLNSKSIESIHYVGYSHYENRNNFPVEPFEERGIKIYYYLDPQE